MRISELAAVVLTAALCQSGPAIAMPLAGNSDSGNTGSAVPNSATGNKVGKEAEDKKSASADSKKAPVDKKDPDNNKQTNNVAVVTEGENSAVQKIPLEPFSVEIVEEDKAQRSIREDELIQRSSSRIAADDDKTVNDDSNNAPAGGNVIVSESNSADADVDDSKVANEDLSKVGSAAGKEDEKAENQDSAQTVAVKPSHEEKEKPVVVTPDNTVKTAENTEIAADTKVKAEAEAKNNAADKPVQEEAKDKVVPAPVAENKPAPAASEAETAKTTENTENKEKTVAADNVSQESKNTAAQNMENASVETTSTETAPENKVPNTEVTEDNKSNSVQVTELSPVEVENSDSAASTVPEPVKVEDANTASDKTAEEEKALEPKAVPVHNDSLLAMVPKELNTPALNEKFPLPDLPQAPKLISVPKEVSLGSYIVQPGYGFEAIGKDLYTKEIADSGATVSQLLAALYRRNPHSFSKRTPVYPFENEKLVIPGIEEILNENKNTYYSFLLSSKGYKAGAENMPPLLSAAFNEKAEKAYDNEVAAWKIAAKKVIRQRKAEAAKTTKK